MIHYPVFSVHQPVWSGPRSVSVCHTNSTVHRLAVHNLFLCFADANDSNRCIRLVFQTYKWNIVNLNVTLFPHPNSDFQDKRNAPFNTTDQEPMSLTPSGTTWYTTLVASLFSYIHLMGRAYESSDLSHQNFAALRLWETCFCYFFSSLNVFTNRL